MKSKKNLMEEILLLYEQVCKEIKERENLRRQNNHSPIGIWREYKKIVIIVTLFLFTITVMVGCPYGAAYFQKIEKKYRDDLDAYQLMYGLLLDESKSGKRLFLKEIEEKKGHYLTADTLQQYADQQGVTLLKLEEVGNEKGKGALYELTIRGSFSLIVNFLGDFQNQFPFGKLEIKNIEGHGGLLKLEGKCSSIITRK